MEDVKKEKVYLVEFLNYTNFERDTVSNHQEGDLHRYLDLSDKPVLIRESELDKYRKFGGGFRSTEFVGYLYE